MKSKRTDVAHVREYSIPVEGKYYYNVQVCQALNSGKRRNLQLHVASYVRQKKRSETSLNLQ